MTYYAITKKEQGQAKETTLYVMERKRDARKMLSDILKTSKRRWGKAGTILENFFWHIDKNGITVLQGEKYVKYKIKPVKEG